MVATATDEVRILHGVRRMEVRMRGVFPVGCHTSSQSGYSLIEVLVACALAGVLIAAAAPSLPRMLGAYALQNATFRVANDLRWARQRAVTTNAKGRIVFASGQYQMRRESPKGSGTYVDDGAPQSLPSGVTVTSSPVNPTFDSRGLPALPYVVTVADGTSPSKTITVTGTGRVNVN